MFAADAAAAVADGHPTLRVAGRGRKWLSLGMEDEDEGRVEQLGRILPVFDVGHTIHHAPRTSLLPTGSE